MISAWAARPTLRQAALGVPAAKLGDQLVRRTRIPDVDIHGSFVAVGGIGSVDYTVRREALQLPVDGNSRAASVLQTFALHRRIIFYGSK